MDRTLRVRREAKAPSCAERIRCLPILSDPGTGVRALALPAQVSIPIHIVPPQPIG